MQKNVSFHLEMNADTSSVCILINLHMIKSDEINGFEMNAEKICSNTIFHLKQNLF